MIDRISEGPYLIKRWIACKTIDIHAIMGNTKTGCILKAWSIKIWLITYFGNKHILKISEILFLLLFKVHPFFKEEINVEQWTINQEQVTMSHFAWLQTTSFFIKYWRIMIDIKRYNSWSKRIIISTMLNLICKTFRWLVSVYIRYYYA